MASWQCPLCQVIFLGTRSRNWHERNLMKSPTDPSRCDNVMQSRPTCVPLVPVPPHEPPEPPEPPEPEHTPKVIDLLLSRRPPAKQSAGLYTETLVQLGLRTRPFNLPGPRDMTVIQRSWKRSVTNMCNSCFQNGCNSSF